MTIAPPDALDDAELAMAAARGSQPAFAAIYDKYADRLHDFCVGMLRDRDAAADCVQDTFVTAATKLVQLREPERLRPWLYAIARHEALSRIRDRRREMPTDELPESDSGEPDLATLAARSELADLIAEACGGLTDRDRTVFELAYRHGLDGPELADALGVSHTNANTLVGRLRESIERSLGALLVCREVRSNPQACAELAALIEHWDGKFTVLMRKRAARHIDNCNLCEAERGRKVNPVALLGAVPVFIPAPALLREGTLGDAFAALPPSTPVAPPAGIGPDSAGNDAPTEAFAPPGNTSWWPEDELGISDLGAETSTAPIAFARDPDSALVGSRRRDGAAKDPDRGGVRPGRVALLVALAVLGLGGVVQLTTPFVEVDPMSVPETSTLSVSSAVRTTPSKSIPASPIPFDSGPAQTINPQSPPPVYTNPPSTIPVEAPATTSRSRRPTSTTTAPATTTTRTTTTTTPTTTTTTSEETTTTTTTTEETTTTTTTTTTVDGGGDGPVFE